MTIITPERDSEAGQESAPDASTEPETSERIDASRPASAPRRLGARRSRESRVLAFIERRLGLTSIGVAVLVLALVVFFAGRAIESRGLLLGGYGLGIVLGISWTLGRRTLTIDADRSAMPSRVRARKPVEVEISLTAGRRISGIIVEETLDEHLGQSVRVPVPVLPGGHSRTHAYGFAPVMRGIYKVGPMVAEWTDPFGLTRRRQEIAPAVDIIVHPSTEPVVDRVTSREWEDPPVRPPISKPWPTGFEFYGMREYSHGDDPRRIVWRAVAQYGKYLVREAEQGITDRINIYLDTAAEGHSPGRDSDTFEQAVLAAASLGSKHLNDGFSVTLNVNSERLRGPLRGRSSQITLLDQLAAVQREGTPFTTALDRLFTDPHRTAHNIVITSNVSQMAASRMRLILDRGASVILVLIVWDDTDPLTLHRAGSLGCNVVEVAAGAPLAAVFQHVVGARRV